MGNIEVKCEIFNPTSPWKRQIADTRGPDTQRGH